jgi:hypothetical protein
MSFPPLLSEIFERPPDLSGLECELVTALPIDFMPVRQSRSRAKQGPSSIPIWKIGRLFSISQHILQNILIL